MESFGRSGLSFEREGLSTVGVASVGLEPRIEGAGVHVEAYQRAIRRSIHTGSWVHNATRRQSKSS